MFHKVFDTTHPKLIEGASTEDLRDAFLITGLFAPGEVRLDYVHHERMIVGGASPMGDGVVWPDARLLERRELGVVNLGPGVGRVDAGGDPHELGPCDALYLGRGVRSLRFLSTDPAHPARFFLSSTPAHAAHPDRFLPFATAPARETGEVACANRRTIRQLIGPETCASAQLLLGLTLLEPGSVWNTVPPHRHARRSEVYFYFDLGKEDCVFHHMGVPNSLRALVVRDLEGVVCPYWSVHMGAGTRPYGFIWAMGGENQDYGDMQGVGLDTLR
ncbi:5-dehydro-4-deoxy-D-glucuronate isomerase [Asticcacaulis sp. AND118]|uniref:5-dehydro-4-deoxy-D-glucuronate isomerase n=1 Tax=Asticcacaulis sp. AND118 TaxID=2840468 RepID=UPI001CFF908E|nr:5-dehydro-4-deoxy-D-glucuronate isomerase [Asticcacaulis sp. AND118]UDF05700.1 5-dehydro-4-deoxy-D-glucuronate isomerase [Asticcacaulis sp. AND118]